MGPPAHMHMHMRAHKRTPMMCMRTWGMAGPCPSLLSLHGAPACWLAPSSRACAVCCVVPAGEEAVTRESFVSICWRLLPYWLNNWEQQWGAECSSMLFELPHFAIELLVVLPCVQVGAGGQGRGRGRG